MFGRKRKSTSDRKYTRKVPSVMAVHQHPIHPMLVVYPTAFLSAMLPADLAWVFLRDEFWAVLSFWLNVGGLLLGVLAAAVGIGDFTALREVRNHVSAWSHAISAVMLLALAATGVWLRWPDPVASVWPWGLLLSAVTLVMVMVTGWLGGTLSFRHGIGVYGEKPPPKDAEGNTPAAE